ncbi:MAG: nickel-dependent lactate racemase [Armatimonadetes bacterium]|nr:nickel-dependent lactate racemase [Armatimonadota bacterium]
MPKETFLLYGKARIPLRVPDHAEVLHTKSVTALPDPVGAVRDALGNPIGSPPLADLLKRQKPSNAVITISDITRPVPNREVLPPVLDTLHAFGLKEEQITILIATGMHRPSTPEERIGLVGADIANRYRIVDHRSERTDELTPMPRPTLFGTKAFINKLYMDADFRIVTGFIEPHFMAGFSGGRKGVCPGLANVETVQKFHGFDFLDSSKAANFVLEGNPLHEEAMDVAGMAGIDFLVNVGLNENKKMAAVFAGDWKEAFFEGAKKVKEWTGARASEMKELVITCAGGDPLDKTLYQTGKGMCSALPLLKEGGTVICASACGEGLGSPSFTKIMNEWGNDWKGFIEWMRNKNDTVHDQWGFQMHCKVLQRVGVSGLLFASGGVPFEDQERMSLTPLYRASAAVSEEEGIRRAIQERIDKFADKQIAVIPGGPYTVAIIG